MSRERAELALALALGLALGDRLAALAAAFDLAASAAMSCAMFVAARAVPAVEAGVVAIALFWPTAVSLSDQSGVSGGGR